MELHLEPPLPLGGGGEGEARWGGEYFARPGPALCPLANVVLPPPEAREEASPNPVPHPHPEPHPHPQPNPNLRDSYLWVGVLERMHDSLRLLQARAAASPPNLLTS